MLTEEIEKIKARGFVPIAVTHFKFEDVFVFATKKEATEAYELCEKKDKCVFGWWYGIEEFEKLLIDFAIEKDSVLWLK